MVSQNVLRLLCLNFSPHINKKIFVKKRSLMDHSYGRVVFSAYELAVQF